MLERELWTGAHLEWEKDNLESMTYHFILQYSIVLTSTQCIIRVLVTIPTSCIQIKHKHNKKENLNGLAHLSFTVVSSHEREIHASTLQLSLHEVFTASFAVKTHLLALEFTWSWWQLLESVPPGVPRDITCQNFVCSSTNLQNHIVLEASEELRLQPWFLDKVFAVSKAFVKHTSLQRRMVFSAASIIIHDSLLFNTQSHFSLQRTSSRSGYTQSPQSLHAALQVHSTLVFSLAPGSLQRSLHRHSPMQS